ncbi:TolC family protein [Ghiorsea bivora]|uniref:TolC family protein n=1 Tax=Ghiorsea bivora TaxID=1485545 RepID=UPI0018E077C8|nr:TolC family protein [Ghiorsea bivora]
MNKVGKIWMTTCLCFVLQTPVQAKVLSLSDVLSNVFAKSPDLQASNVQVHIQRANSLQLDGALDMQYGGSIGLSNESAPTTNPFAPTETNAAFVSGQVVQPFEDGSTLTGTLLYNSAELIYPASVIPEFQSKPNPQYEHQIDLIYRYPLVAGSGNPNYTYQKEASLAEEKAAKLRIALLKEQIAGQAIGMYAQFVLSDLSLKLAKDAVFRAAQLLENQKKRESFGLVEKADRYQTEALLAARKLQLAQAKAEKRAAQTALNRLMYQDAGTPLVVKFSSPKVQLQSVSQMLAKAESKRPVFQVLAAQYKAAEAQLSLAQTSDDYQLDLIGQVGTRALSGNAGTAFTKGFNPVHDRYIGISVEFSDVLDNKSSHAAVQKSVLALESINIERRKAVMDLQTEIATLLNDLHSAKITLKASKAQVKAEKKKYQAEMERYQKGRVPTSTVIQFEGDLRAAQLREAIQRVSLGLTEYKLALAVGELPELLRQTQGDAQ